jgi:hypothetical protein
MLHIFSPRYALAVEQVYNRRDVGRKPDEIIIIQAEVVTGYGRSVVRF